MKIAFETKRLKKKKNKKDGKKQKTKSKNKRDKSYANLNWEMVRI